MIIPIFLILAVSQTVFAYGYTGTLHLTGNRSYCHEGYIFVRLNRNNGKGELRILDYTKLVRGQPFKIKNGGLLEFNDLRTPDGPLEKITSINLKWKSVKGGGCLGLFKGSKAFGIERLVLNQEAIGEDIMERTFCT